MKGGDRSLAPLLHYGLLSGGQDGAGFNFDCWRSLALAPRGSRLVATYFVVVR
jgi:hypothetical protein